MIINTYHVHFLEEDFSITDRAVAGFVMIVKEQELY
jgi:hypothetical protein